jgi:hypothetical protein
MTVAAEHVPLTCSVVRQEMRGVTLNFPSGKTEPGYQWRLLLRYPATATTAAEDRWTEWALLSPEMLDALMVQWAQFLVQHGHSGWVKGPPAGTPIQ